MTGIIAALRRGAEVFIGLLIGLMFLTFILQITVRYTARLPWVSETLPFLDPTRYGWTLEFSLLLWIWIIFAGAAFVVRRVDHVTFDLLYDAMRPQTRRWLVIIGGLLLAAALLASVEPTWNKFYILRLKKTASLTALFGDWIRIRDVYAVYMFFLIAVPLRLAWEAWRAFKTNPDELQKNGDAQ